MLIYRRGLPVATGRIRDASAVGVFVETGYAELREHQRLEFEWVAPTGSGEMRHRVPAHVRRCGPGGVALEIDDADARIAVAMGALLRGSHAGAEGGTAAPQAGAD